MTECTTSTKGITRYLLSLPLGGGETFDGVGVKKGSEANAKKNRGSLSWGKIWGKESPLGG